MKRIKRMELQKLKTVDDGFGDGAPDQWARVSDIGVELKPLAGREYEQAQQMKSSVTHNARCRFIPNVNSAMRLEYEGRVFNIESVTNWQERNKFLALKLIEV